MTHTLSASVFCRFVVTFLSKCQISNVYIFYFVLKKVLDSVCPETCTIQKTISQFKNT